MTRIITAVDGDGVARLALRGPETLNALDDSVVAEFGRALTAALADDRVRVIIVEGDERSFSVGGDLDMLASMRREVADGKGAAVEARLRTNSAVVQALMTASKPTIALVEGYCIGAAIAIVAACDIRLGSPRTTFDTAYLKAGLGSDFGLPWLLSRICGMPQTAALLLSPERIGADRAHRIGLVTEVSEDARDRAALLAKRIAGFDRAAVTAMTENLRDAPLMGFAEYAAAEARRFVQVLA